MRDVRDRIEWLVETGGNPQFFIPLIIPEIVAGITAAVGAAGLAIPAALTAPLIAGAALTAPLDIGVGAALGAGLGAGEAALTGGKPGLGALTGGLTGAVAPFGPSLGTALGIGEMGGDILVGAGTGLIGSEITGQNPLTGTLTGAASGVISGLTSGGGSTMTAGSSPGGVGPGSAPATTSTPAPSLTGGAGNAPAFGDIQSSVSGDSGGSIWSGPESTISSTALPSASSTISGTAPTPSAPGNIATATPVTGGSNITQTSGPPLGPDAGQGTIFSGMATAPTPAAGDVYATPGTQPGFFDRLGNQISDLANNPMKLAGIALSAGMLGYEELGPQKGAEQQDINQLQSAAAGANSMARMLEAPLTSGVLPTGAQVALDQSQAAQDAIERSKFISMGMAGSTSEADALSAVRQNIGAEKVSIEEDMFGQAYNYNQLASTDYQRIIGDQMQMDANQAAALGRFVAALTGAIGGTKTVA